MGVPKFFRYMSERYPCLSEQVKEYQIPEFDNLYLDMNGIIHMCSHPDDNNPHFRITEERIFKDIFHYIEVLFRMIKPQKLFFMAVDGVAPRAKMNQQRGRRFRSAKDAEKLEKEAKKRGETLPTESRFDSNCITPGTPFMARLQEQLKYFVVEKITTDKMWQKCKVILSGHETPGEGEHKIMDYIRYLRSQPGYDPNTRHCLYGLDADLIMLGLCTHDPHFSLLREEVKFGKKSTKRNSVPEEIKFYLLHLSLMREYLELEFASVKDKLTSFKFDIEKIIDDWVLMGFLVGNDFIPHLPNLHIANGALPILYKAYMEILPTLDGYINEAGFLNLSRFETFMKKLGELDVENFEEVRDDLFYMEAKTGRKQEPFTKVTTKPKDLIQWQPEDDDFKEETLQPQKPKDPGLEALIRATEDMCLDSTEESNDDEDDAFENYKKCYYKNKLEYENVTPDVLRDQAEGYVRAIQWNLHYYYNGVCSWSWYYPHHYAPYISDIKGFSDLKLEYELGKPFLPYEQLLAVLPSASKNLLPECYQNLMTHDSSSIKQYYPEDFETDLNGKKQEWEAVVLVPFIDEKKLLEAMKLCNDKLTHEEASRNKHGPMHVYIYSDQDFDLYESPGYFPNIAHHHANIKTLDIEQIRVPIDKLIKGAYPGVLLDVFYPGFPTLKHLDYKGALKKAKVKVFEQPSRNESMIISILPKEEITEAIPHQLLGKSVFVAWPHLVEAKIISISNKAEKYIYMGEGGQYNVEPADSMFDQEVEFITEYYKTRMGIEVGKTKVLVKVQVMIGRRYAFTPNGRVNLEKTFSKVTANYPLQSIVADIAYYDNNRSTYQDIQSLFTVGSKCFTLTNPYYGSIGTVKEYGEAQNGRVKLCITINEEPDFTPVTEIEKNIRYNYKSATLAASQLAISNHTFSRVTGTIYITVPNGEGGLKNINVGLDLKLNKRNLETPGYTKKIDNVWYYTDKVINLVRNYMNEFPEIFQFLTHSGQNDPASAEEAFGYESEEKVKAIQSWLKALPTHHAERRVCGSAVAEPEVVAEIEKIVEAFNNSKRPAQQVNLQIKPNFLYKPEISSGNVAPDPNAEIRLLDRVVNVREGYTVPLGLKGTVIGIHEPADGDGDLVYDVVFDSPFEGAISCNCSADRGYLVPKYSLINISHGLRLRQKTGAPLNFMNQQKKDYASTLYHKQPNYQEQANYAQNSQSRYYPQQPNYFQQQKPNSQPSSAFVFYNYNNQGNIHNISQNVHRGGQNIPAKPGQYPNYQFSNDNSGYQLQPQANPNPYFFQNAVQFPQRNAPNRAGGKGPNQHDEAGNFSQVKEIKDKSNQKDFMPQFNLQGLVQKNARSSKSATTIKGRQVKEDAAPVTLPETNKTEAIAHTSTKSPSKKAPANYNQENHPLSGPKVDTDFLRKMLKIGADDKASDSSVKKDINKDVLCKPGPSKSEVSKQTKTNGKANVREDANQQSSVILLLNYYQAKGLGLPRYQHFNIDSDVVQSRLTLPNQQVLIGTPGKDKEEANENVASEALNVLMPNEHKKVLPNFPTPPRKWVQDSPNPKMVNAEKQKKVQQSTASKNVNKNNSNAASEPSPRKEFRNDKKGKTLSNAFVPLQVVKRLNKTNGSVPNDSKANIENNKSNDLKSNSTSSLPTESTAQKQNAKLDKNAKPRKQRQMRIAANFNMK